MLTVPTTWPTTLTLTKSFWLECGPNQVPKLDPANLNWCVREGVVSFLAVSVLLAWSVKASDCGPWSHANWSPSAKHAYLQCLWHPKSRAGPSTSLWRRQMPRASVTWIPLPLWHTSSPRLERQPRELSRAVRQRANDDKLSNLGGWRYLQIVPNTFSEVGSLIAGSTYGGGKIIMFLPIEKPQAAPPSIQ